jgi:hypothetical protein
VTRAAARPICGPKEPGHDRDPSRRRRARHSRRGHDLRRLRAPRREGAGRRARRRGRQRQSRHRARACDARERGRSRAGSRRDQGRRLRAGGDDRRSRRLGDDVRGLRAPRREGAARRPRRAGGERQSRDRPRQRARGRRRGSRPRAGASGDRRRLSRDAGALSRRGGRARARPARGGARQAQAPLSAGGGRDGADLRGRDGLPSRSRLPSLADGRGRSARAGADDHGAREFRAVRPGLGFPAQGLPRPRQGRARHEFAGGAGLDRRLGLFQRRDARARADPASLARRLFRVGGGGHHPRPARKAPGGARQGPRRRGDPPSDRPRAQNRDGAARGQARGGWRRAGAPRRSRAGAPGRENPRGRGGGGRARAMSTRR